MQGLNSFLLVPGVRVVSQEAISRSYSVVTRNFFAVNFYEQLKAKICQFLRLTTRLFWPFHG